jgi:hypothetical protein
MKFAGSMKCRKGYDRKVVRQRNQSSQITLKALWKILPTLLLNFMTDKNSYLKTELLEKIHSCTTIDLTTSIESEAFETVREYSLKFQHSNFQDLMWILV